MSDTDVIVIGAGPYGLSVSAHLAERGLRVRTFGRVMETWADRMPRGMLLKSEGFASTISDPRGRWTLERFCSEDGRPFAPVGAPVPGETFADYGRWFARNAVPDIDETLVATVQRLDSGFAAELEDGRTLEAPAVVVASGVSHFPYVPPELEALPPDRLSHSSALSDPGTLADRDVAVIGLGQSALESAALLREAGARPTVVARCDHVVWNGRPDENASIVHRLRWPISPLGTGARLWAYANGARWFRWQPSEVRSRAAWRTLGPAGAWWLRERIEGKVPLLLGQSVRRTSVDVGGVTLRVASATNETGLRVDHVLAATGYRVHLGRLSFLTEPLRGAVRRQDGCPHLDGGFQSSVAGLYFVGLPATASFGPVMRFVCGTGVAGRLASAHVARTLHRPRPRRLRRGTDATVGAAGLADVE